MNLKTGDDTADGTTAETAVKTVEKAKELLKNTNKNMSYILDACGFGSEKTFYRTFHQKTGLTPKEFREKGQHQSHNDVLKGYLDFSIPEARAILREVIRQHE